MASTASLVAGPMDEGEDCGFDACEDGADEVGDEVPVAEGVEDSAAPPPTVAELIELTRREREPATAPPTRTASPPEPEKERPQGDILERAGVPTNVLAATIQPDPEQPGMGKIVPHSVDERADRRRLGAAMLGVGGPLDRLMMDGSAMSALDTETGRGLRFGLVGSGPRTIEELVMGEFAAAAIVLQGRMMAAAARCTRDSSPGSAKAARDYMRASTTGLGLVERTLEAVDLVRARRRDRTEMPVFVVGRVPTGDDGGGKKS